MFSKEHKNFQIALFITSIANVVLAISLVLVLFSIVLGHSIGAIFQIEEINQIGQENFVLINNIIYIVLILIAGVNFFSAVYSIVSMFLFHNGFSIATSVVTLVFGFFISHLFHWNTILRIVTRLLPYVS